MAAPTVTTSAATLVTAVQAVGNGSITDPGDSAVTDYGICWSTSETPTVSDPHTSVYQPSGSYDVVVDGSLDNTGATDTVDAILAIIAAGHTSLYFPAGEYLLDSELTVPDSITMVGPSGLGPSGCTAWLQGKILFGSHSTFTDLKIGPELAGVASIQNTDGSDGTTFTRCHFRGGGAAYPDSDNYMTARIGNGADVSGLSFVDCEFERSLGTDWEGSSTEHAAENTISITSQGNTVDGVDFTDCHFGVTNGVATGAQRMMIEVWTAHGTSNWWKDVHFHGCEFEASNIHQLDFACYGDSGQGTGVIVEDCLFHGGGVEDYDTGFGYGLVLEWPADALIQNNTFYRCNQPAIWDANFGQSRYVDWTITGNTIDYDTNDASVSVGRSLMAISAAGLTITGNTLTCTSAIPWPSGAIELHQSACTGNTVTGNTITIPATESAVVEVSDAHDNVITPNTVVNP